MDLDKIISRLDIDEMLDDWSKYASVLSCMIDIINRAKDFEIQYPKETYKKDLRYMLSHSNIIDKKYAALLYYIYKQRQLRGK